MEFLVELAKTSLTVALLAAGIYFLYRYFSNQVHEKDQLIKDQMLLKDRIIQEQSDFIKKFSVDNVKMMSDFGKTLDHVIQVVRDDGSTSSETTKKILEDIQTIRLEMNSKISEILLAVKTKQ